MQIPSPLVSRCEMFAQQLASSGGTAQTAAMGRICKAYHRCLVMNAAYDFFACSTSSSLSM